MKLRSQLSVHDKFQEPMEAHVSEKPQFPLESLPFHEKPAAGMARLYLMVSAVLERMTEVEERPPKKDRLS